MHPSQSDGTYGAIEQKVHDAVRKRDRLDVRMHFLTLRSASAHRCITRGSVAGHGVVPQELGHRSCDGLGTLDVEEMADAIDRALLDVRE